MRAKITALLLVAMAAGAACSQAATAGPRGDAGSGAPEATTVGLVTSSATIWPAALEGRALVTFRAGVSMKESRAAAARAAGEHADEVTMRRVRAGALRPLRDLFVVRAPGVRAEALVRRLADDPRVARVEPDLDLRLDVTVPDDPLFASQWGMARIEAPSAWDVTTGSPGVVIADIDTGVRYDHPDLAANMWRNPQEWGGVPGVDDDGNGYVDDLYGIDATGGDSDPLDEDVANSHGTHTAGVIAASGDNGVGVAGVSWATRVMALKCFDATGAGTVSQSIECIDYAVWQKQHGVDVVAINASWGGDAYSAFLRYAIKAAGDAGIVFVAAAGNTGQDTDVTPHYPASYPERNILAVANSTQTDARRSSSCWGAASVDLAAPGTDILSTVGTATDPSGYTTLTGTSMAAPHVSGAIALCASKYPAEGVEERIDRVLRGVDALPDWTDLCASGGRLDVRAALDVSAPTDDDIPGLRLHASPVGGTVAVAADPTDVYRVRLLAGDTLEASVTHGEGVNADLALFDQSAASATDLADAVARATAAASPDRLCYEVPHDAGGTYYLAVTASSGAGEYQIAYTVGSNDTPAGASVLVPSPATGSLEAATDAHDVWKLPLVSGQVLRASLAGPVGTDFRLALYAPWAAGFDPGALLAAVTSGAYPRAIARQATEDGAFYLDASSASGDGPYQLVWTVDSPADNEIPGVPLPSSPVAGSLSPGTDLCDVYAVDLTAGVRFAASVVAGDGTDCDLYLFEPGKTHVWADAATQWAGGSTYPDGFTYTPPTSGTYFLMVRERSGAAAAYSITWSGGRTDDRPPVTTASGVPAGWSRKAVTVTFSAEDADSGVQQTEYSLDGGATYTPGDSVTLSAPGVHRLLYRSRDRAGNVETAREAVVRIDPSGPVTAALAKVVARKGKSASFSFKVKDLTPTAKVTIRIYAGRSSKATLKVGARPTGRKLHWTWRRCTLPKGSYTWKVLAVDLAGNHQSRAGSSRLLIR